MSYMGIGNLGAPGIIIKRKFRFTFEINTPCGYIPRHYVKIAAKPSLEVDETEINFLNDTTWVPGKARWQPINITYIDVANDPQVIGLYNWFNTIYDFTVNPLTQSNQSEKAGWNGTALLTMLDGCGNPLEYWFMGSCWPTSINFGTVEYADSSEATIELTMRYSNVRYQNVCGPQPTSCCSGCY